MESPPAPRALRPRSGAGPPPTEASAPRRRRRTRLVTRLAAMVTLLLGGALAIPTLLVYFARGRELYDRAVASALGRGELATIGIAEAIGGRELRTLDRLLAALVTENNGVSAASIIDAGGNCLRAATLDLGMRALEPFVVPEATIVESACRDGRDCVLVTTPVIVDGMPWGALRQEVDLSRVAAAEREVLFQIVGVALSLLILGIGCAALVARSIASPVERLAALAGEVARGRLDCVANVRRSDELGALGAAFDAMTTQLRTSHRRLREQSAALEQQVVERTAELAMARDAALGAARAKSEFLANMSHEIRTPLNGLLGFLGLLSETGIDSRQREYLDIARGSGEALLALLNDILDLSKIEAGKLTLENIEFEREDLLESVACLFAPLAQVKGVEFLLDVDPRCPVRMRSDPTRLRQVLSNLLGNAVKFTAAGEVRLRVRATRQDARSFLRFEVCDTGEGIAADRLATLFNAFQQADGSTSRRHGGTGLGLAIVKRIVMHMGGHVAVESEVGVGSRFTVTVPVEVVPSPVRDRRVAAAVGTPVLVVDGHLDRGELLARQLRGLGCEVELEPDVQRAAARVRVREQNGVPVGAVFVDESCAGAWSAIAAGLSPAPRCYALRPAPLANDAPPPGFVGALVKPVRRAVLVRTMARPGAGPVRAAPVEVEAVPAPPAAPAAAADPAPVLAQEPARHVLVVEDQLVNQKLMASLLAKFGLRVTVAADGRSGVDAWARSTFDLVLMDMQMPVMDGLQATAEIRRREAGKRRVPIVALTANALAGDRERCLKAGMDDYLTKPVRPTELRAAIERWLERGAGTKAARA